MTAWEVVKAVLVGMAALAAFSCSYSQAPVVGQQSKSPPPSGLGTLAVKPQDLPNTVICIQSGQPADFLRQSSASSDRQSIQQEVDRIKPAGKVDAWVQVLAPTQTDCVALLNGSSGYTEPVATNFLARFRDESAARSAFANGFGALRPGGVDVVSGASTGLGPDSLAKPLAKGWTAFWRKGAYLSFIAADGVSADQARQAAVAIDSRLH